MFLHSDYNADWIKMVSLAAAAADDKITHDSVCWFA